MAASSQVTCIEVQGADHFAVPAPTNKLMARTMLSNTAGADNLSLTEEAGRNFKR